MPVIQDARVIVSCPGRNFVTLKLTTADGVRGLGDATLNGRELAVASYLTEHVLPCLIGRDAHRIEDIWQFLYRGAYWRRGPVTMSAIAAVDTALWDIKAKIAGLPLYQLLGGGCRSGCLVYGHANGETIEATIAHALEHRAAGYRAIRLQSGVPGLASTYGVAHGARSYEPADAALPRENAWSTPKYLRAVAPLFAAAREALGWDVHLLHDVHHRLTPIEAARLCQDLEPYRPFWIEDAVPADNQASFRLIRQHTTTPLAVGEVFNSIWDCKQLSKSSSSTTSARPWCTPAASVTCGGWQRSPICTTCAPDVTARPICRRYAWPRHCTSGCPFPTSASRSTCRTLRPRIGRSRIITASRTATCIRVRRRAWVSRSTKPSLRHSPTSAPTCR